MIPNYSLPNHVGKETFKEMELKTVAIEICFFLAMLYREGYCLTKSEIAQPFVLPKPDVLTVV